MFLKATRVTAVGAMGHLHERVMRRTLIVLYSASQHFAVIAVTGKCECQAVRRASGCSAAVVFYCHGAIAASDTRSLITDSLGQPALAHCRAVGHRRDRQLFRSRQSVRRD